MEDRLEKGLDVHRRRSDLEVKAELAIALRKVVNKAFRKKDFDDNFTEAELEKIKEIDTFLRMVSQHKNPEGFDETRKKYLYICCKSKYVRKDGTEIMVFVNRPIDQDDFNYKKVDMFIAKCFYHLSLNRHIEVYFGVNSFKGIVREGKFRIERKQDNVVSSCCLFTDIDLPKELQELSDEEVLSMIKEDYEELFINVPPTYIIRSGGGVHIYFCFEESFYLENEEQQEEYRCALKTLQLLFESFGGDPAVVDRTRILRSPHSYNRKDKYGKQGKEVSILEFNDITYDFVQLKKDLEFLLEGGMEGLQEDILDDIFMDYDYSYIEETDEAETIQETEEPKSRKRERKEHTAIQRMIDFQYKGIQPYYDYNNEQHYLARDLMIWLQNRDNHESKRHKILFFFHYIWYVLNGIRTEERLMERSLKLNTYFKPSLDNHELEELVKYNIRYLNAREHKPRNIRHMIIQSELHFTDEELTITQGIYCDTYKEYEEKRRIRGNIKDYERYIRTREEQGKRPKGEAKQKNLEIIKQNPLISYREFHELTGLSKTTYDDYKKVLNYDREFRKKLIRDKWLQPFKDTPKISCSEYCKLMNCSKATFEKYRAIFNKL